MSKEEVHDLLVKLKREVKNLDSNSDIHKEINSLISDIEQKLALNETSLTENIRNYIEQFEAEHPRVTNILSELMIKLMNIGI